MRVLVRHRQQPQDPHQDRARGQDPDPELRSSALPRFSAAAAAAAAAAAQPDQELGEIVRRLICLFSISCHLLK